MSATTPSTIKPVPKKGWLTRLRQRNVLPGFGLSMGITVFSLSLLVVLPFA
ncbi:MAG TPA: molybdate ABC transporter permease subunit, partial [Psychrobacter sp.]|nr:molybdate ABC transporter permease subunit [Psychrobacter sp.]